MYFKYTTHRIIDGGNVTRLNVNTGGYAPICIRCLYSRIRQYGGFTAGRRVFGRAPKLPISTVGNPHLKDAIYHNGSPVIQQKNALSKLKGVQKRRYEAIFKENSILAIKRAFGH